MPPEQPSTDSRRFALSPRGRPEDRDFLLDRTPPAELKATMHSCINYWAQSGGLVAEQNSAGWWQILTAQGEIASGQTALTLAEAAAWLQLRIEAAP